MDAQQFLAEFGHIANAPRGVVRLRELVLALAVSGRLIERPEITESLAADFLRKLEQELADYKAANKYRRTSGDREAASKLKAPAPVGWINARLGQIGVLIRGVTYNKSVARASNEQGMTGLLRATNIGANVSFDDLVYVPSDLVDKEQLLCAGDVLIAMSSGSKDLVGKAAIVLEDSEFGFGAFCGAFRPMPSLRREFIRVAMQSPQYRDYVADQGKGIGINNLTKAHIEEYEFFLPPPEEQSRIVAKVDELMALCNKLEAQQQVRRKVQNNLRHSTLQAVAGATSPHELQTTWARLADNFGRLFHAPEDVRMLRDVIFDLALRGALLPDVTHEDSADSIADGATPLPDGWDWKTLAELSEYITSGSRGWKSYVSSIGDSFIRSQDIKHDALIFENPAFVSLPAKAEGKRTLVRQGDLLLTITGGNVGKCATVPALNQDAYVSQHVALIRLREPWLAEFIHIWMINAFGGRLFLARYIYGDKPGLNLAQVGSIPIPVPTPSACVAILEQLRTYQAMCAKLERQLKVKQETAAALVLAAVSSLTGIAIEQEKVTISSEAETV